MLTSFRRLQLLTSVAAIVLAAAPAARAQTAPAPAAPPDGAYAPAPPAPAEPPAATPAPPPPAPAPAAPQRGTPGAQPRKLGVLLRMNLEFGGEKVVTVIYTNGSSKSINAGERLAFSAGVLYHPDAPYALEATIGYKFQSLEASNGTIGFTRWPLDIIASYANGRHRLGLGPTIHLAPNFGCHATGVCEFDTKFNDAVGGIAQYAYSIPMGTNAGVDLAIRYTAIRYTNASTNVSGDGSNTGFVLGAWF